jgi:hypothetical protein
MEKMMMIPGYLYDRGNMITEKMRMIAGYFYDNRNMITEKMRMILGYMVEEEHDSGEDEDDTCEYDKGGA